MENTIVFSVDNGTKEIIRLEPNGDIIVKGKLIENDKELVDGLREFLMQGKQYNQKEVEDGNI